MAVPEEQPPAVRRSCDPVGGQGSGFRVPEVPANALAESHPAHALLNFKGGRTWKKSDTELD